METQHSTPRQTDRRDFLRKCGRFAVVTPTAITMLLSTSLTTDAIAKSGGRKARHHRRGHHYNRRHHDRPSWRGGKFW